MYAALSRYASPPPNPPFPQSFASFDYEEGPLRAAPLVLLELLVNGKAVDALSRLVAAQVGAPGARGSQRN